MVGPNIEKEFNSIYKKLKKKLDIIVKDVNTKTKYGGFLKMKDYKTVLVFYNYMNYIKKSPFVYRRIRALYHISNFLNKIK